jgi:oxygen-dependent protoporphyrinogen oxidase
MIDPNRPHVAVIGGGISGLVAARAVARAGMQVTVVEAGSALGGQIRTVDFAGSRVEVGAEALHLGVPAMTALLAELGLDDQVVKARPGSAWLWNGRRLRPLPAGVGPAGPTRIGPVLRARVLSAKGIARAALEPVLPRTPTDPDVGVGVYIGQRFGREVRDRLVDPVLGALHAGDVDRLSLHAAAPHLAAIASKNRSLLLAHRARGKGPAPSFATLTDGLDTLVHALAAEDGVSTLRATPVRSITIDSSGARSRYEVAVGSNRSLLVDGVVIAVPAAVAVALLAELAPSATAPMAAMNTVSVATVLAAYPRRATSGLQAFDGTGVLVDSSAQRHLKAATFLSRKWGHLDSDHFLVRMSAGRLGGPDLSVFDDDELAATLHADLAEATGLRAPPLDVHVERWPSAMAQLEVGHTERMATVRSALDAFPGLALAGAPFDGVGLAACITSGQRAAASLRDVLTPQEVCHR